MRSQQYFVLILVIGFFYTFGVSDAYARSQRMGVPKGTIATLAPKSSQSVGAFCLDYHRPAPTADTRLGHVLTGSGSAMVQIEDQGAGMPLSQAISEGIVRVGGLNLDGVEVEPEVYDEIQESSLMNLMLPPELTNPDWFDQTPAERLAFLKAKLEARVVGDWRHLELENLTEKEITVSFAETTVLSEAPESIADSRVNDLRPLRPGESPEELQNELWVRDSERQLKELGFFEGEIDGVPDDQLVGADTAFREALGVAAQDISDSAVAELLAHASTLRQEAVALSTTPPPRIAVRIEQLESPPPVLMLVAAHGQPKGVRNAGDLGDFVDVLLAEAVASKHIEFDLSGFRAESQADLDALITTIRIQLAAKSPETELRFSGKIDPVLLVRLDGNRPYPKGPVFDPKTQRWTMETLLIAQEPLVIRVWAKTRDAVVELFRAINRILQREPDLLLLSQEDLAMALRKSLEKEQRNIEDGDIELINPLGQTVLVEQLQPPAGVRNVVALR